MTEPSIVSTERRFDPMDIVIEPGVTVRDLEDRPSMQAAISILEFQIAEIKAQLSLVPPVTMNDPDWRRRAESALRIKKHALQIIRTKLSLMRMEKQAAETEKQAADRARPLDGKVRKLSAIITTFRDELGDEEVNRLVGIARARHPDLFEDEP